jgi:hypothetical protein
MFVTPDGLTYAISQGTAIIRYTSPSGVAILGMDYDGSTARLEPVAYSRPIPGKKIGS